MPSSLCLKPAAHRLLRLGMVLGLACRLLGAEESTHWSFLPLKSPAPPRPADNPIDAFIIERLEQAGLALSPQADRRSLLRRLHYDLLGLPPTLQEVSDFERDNSPDALDRRVRELLARPQYGERWARHWLDVVHYGESHGYDKDKPRPNAWPYRDYVIGAFNADKPYARFVAEQIAGDVLYPGSVDGITALGFIAAGPWDYIGHAEVPETKTDGKIARHLDRDDMVSNTLNTFLSLTVHCAQCHDHKFDPVSQADYYRLQAVFAAVDRTEVDYYTDPALMQTHAKAARQRQQLQAQIASIEADLKKKAGADYTQLSRLIDAPSGNNPNAKPDYGYHSQLTNDATETKWVQVDLGQSQPILRVVIRPCHDDFGGIGSGFGFPLRFKIEASDDPEFKTAVSLLWRRHDATFMNDFPNPGLKAFETGSAPDDGIKARFVRVTATKLAERRRDHMLALSELEVYAVKDGPNLALARPVSAKDSIEAPPRWRRSNLTDGLFPQAADGTDKRQLIVRRDALLLAQANSATRKRLTDLRAQRDALPRLPAAQKVYAAAVHHGSGSFRGTGPDGGKPRPIHLLRRGDVKQPAQEMQPGSPAQISKLLDANFPQVPMEQEGARRAALAQWLTQSNNALLWRSIVNRVWQYHFGRGIVETPNDFGRMGAAPSHPELLDWLACWFRDEAKGSLKALHRLILSSQTWQQRSNAPAALQQMAAAKDANNALLWRQNRRRLEAEAIRDSILLSAGKLDLRMGGPSFQDFVIEKPEHSPHYQYHLADPDNPALHRRSVYRFLVRSQQQPWMSSLDCADPSVLVDRRNQTITPLQALAQLNNPLCLAMAEHFAKRLPASHEMALREAFHVALQREPTAAERASLLPYLQQHGAANTCRLLLNLNEFVFVD
jgi:hypothetical protein